MPRFSILGLFGLICGCAAGMAAVLASNDLWAGGVSMVTLVLLGVAAIRSIQGRAAWLGFLVFCGGSYAAVRLLPAREVASLPTTYLVNRLGRWCLPVPGMSYGKGADLGDPWADPLPLYLPRPTPNSPWRLRLHPSANPDSFRAITHNLLALMLGGCGAWFACWAKGRDLRDQRSTQGS